MLLYFVQVTSSIRNYARKGVNFCEIRHLIKNSLIKIYVNLLGHETMHITLIENFISFHEHIKPLQDLMQIWIQTCQ